MDFETTTGSSGSYTQETISWGQSPCSGPMS